MAKNFLKVEIVGEDDVKYVFNRLNIITAQKVKDAVNESAIDIEREAKKLCPVDTGRLRSSIRTRFWMGGFAADIYTNVEYAVAVEFGVDHPVTIRPKKAKVLRFKAPAAYRLKDRKALYRTKTGRLTVNKEKGEWIFAKKVTIPPRPAQPFLFPAYEQIRPKYYQRLKKALQDAGKKLESR